MAYIKNGTEYPRHAGDIENESPGWDPSQELPAGWAAVEESPLPAKLPAQRIEEISPELVSGAWIQQWRVVDLTEVEMSGESTDPHPKATRFDIESSIPK